MNAFQWLRSHDSSHDARGRGASLHHPCWVQPQEAAEQDNINISVLCGWTATLGVVVVPASHCGYWLLRPRPLESYRAVNSLHVCLLRIDLHKKKTQPIHITEPLKYWTKKKNYPEANMVWQSSHAEGDSQQEIPTLRRGRWMSQVSPWSEKRISCRAQSKQKKRENKKQEWKEKTESAIRTHSREHTDASKNQTMQRMF